MATRKVLLAEDVTGKLVDNLITDEAIVTDNGRDRLVVLEYGAFFEEGFILTDGAGAVVDRAKYMFCDLYEEATRKSAKSVWNSVIILDSALGKNFKATYQGYGGRFAANGRILIEWLQERLAEATSPIEWNDLTDKPKEFLPAWHMQLWQEVYGFSYIKNALTSVENAIRIDNSIFFKMLIADIRKKLADADAKAKDIALFYAKGAVYDATKNISKETLNLHLIANLATALDSEMEQVAKSNFDGSLLLDDKYINKRGLLAFTKVLKERSATISSTNLGLPAGVIKTSIRGSLLSLANGGIIILESKNAIANSGSGYEENCYPKNYPDGDRFTISRITNNLYDHGGAFLGFNNTTGEMFSGILQDDKCFRRIKWYKFYSDISYQSIMDVLNKHIQQTNNPHNLTKDQVHLDKVWNFPVTTEEEILTQNYGDSYVTLDVLQMFMTAHLLDLKGELKEDGTLDKDKDPFNSPNLIFTPCDKKVPDNWPPAGQMLKTYCDGTDRFKRVADGKGSFTDEVLQLDSDDCKFFDTPKQGEVVSKSCDGTTLKNRIADGRGSDTEVVVEINSTECGYEAPPAIGSIIREGCEGMDFICFYADGVGGEIKMTHEVNSEKCGFTTTTTTTPAPAIPTPLGIRLDSSMRKIEVGTPEVFTGQFSGFPPFTTISFVMEQREPLGTIFDGAFKDWIPAINGTVDIGADGSGVWNETLVDDGYTVPRGTSWNNRIVAESKTSNTIVRDFVGSGMSAPNDPVVITTQPPGGTGGGSGGAGGGGNMSINMHFDDTVVDTHNMRGKVAISVSGAAVSSFYYQLMWINDTWLSMGGDWPTRWQEAYNGVIATNSGGAGSMNIPYDKFLSSISDMNSGTGNIGISFKVVIDGKDSNQERVTISSYSGGGA